MVLLEKCINPNKKESRLVGHALVYLLKHIWGLFRRGMEHEGKEDKEALQEMELKFHAIGRAIGFHSYCIKELIHVPGMPDYLFSKGCENFMSPSARFVKKHLSAYCKNMETPTQEYIGNHISDPYERERVMKAIKKLSKISKADKDPCSMQYAYGHYALMVAAAVEGTATDVSSNDGRGRLRLGRDDNKYLTIVAIRECLSLWTDPLVRASCLDALAPAASLALTSIEEFTGMESKYFDYLEESEVAPGLDIDKAILTCLVAIREEALNVDYAIQILVLISSYEKEVTDPLWSGIRTDRRAMVFLAILDYIDEHWAKNEFIFEVLAKLMTQTCSSNDAVWEIAAGNEVLGPRRTGSNIPLRALIHYFTRAKISKSGHDVVETIAKIKSISLLYEKNARTRVERHLLSELKSCKVLAETVAHS